MPAPASVTSGLIESDLAKSQVSQTELISLRRAGSLSARAGRKSCPIVERQRDDTDEMVAHLAQPVGNESK
jgi:hypothetical protein